MPGNDTHKKTEFLEVRIAHETKQRLADKARRESRTVSDVIRDQVQIYLSDDVSEKQAGIGAAIIRSIRVIIAGGIAIFLFGLSTFMPANAGTISAVVKGSVKEVESLEPRSVRTRSFVANVLVEDESSVLELPLDHETISMTMKLQPTQLLNGQDAVMVELAFYEQTEAGKKLIVSPKLVSAFDAPAQFAIGSDADRMFDLTVIPSRTRN